MRTYRSIADTLGVQLCPDAEGSLVRGCDLPVAAHDSGGWDRGIVHWTDRSRITPRGLYRFLMFSALALNSSLTDEEDWRRIYLAHMALNRLARKARIRIPSELTTVERRRVKALLVGVPRDTPLREKAFRWARR